MKVYDYINGVDKRFRVAIFKGMNMLSPSRSYASPWIDLACVYNFLFSMQHFPKEASEPGLCVDDMHKYNTKELWAVMVILLTTNVLFLFGGIVG